MHIEYVARHGTRYPTSGDVAKMGKLAAALQAIRLVLLTDVAGVLDDKGRLVEEMNLRRAKRLLASKGTVAGGMIPKLQTAVQAVEAGVEASAILDGRARHALLLELLTAHGAGTLIRR